MLQTHDGQQLIGILDELTEHKEDSQQRTWAVHEDEGILHKLLKNLLSILVSILKSEKRNSRPCMRLHNLQNFCKNIKILLLLAQH